MEMQIDHDEISATYQTISNLNAKIMGDSILLATLHP